MEREGRDVIALYNTAPLPQKGLPPSKRQPFCGSGAGDETIAFQESFKSFSAQRNIKSTVNITVALT